MTEIAASVDAKEVDRFSQLAQRWWDPDGPFRPLHQMNPVRLDYIRTHVCAAFGRDPRAFEPLAGLAVLDVGCGGGLLCEPMARLGADVTGVDASEEGIAAACHHAQEMGLEIVYRADTAEALAESGARFDVVLAMEIVEHVADRQSFCRALAALTAPEGIAILSTLNRTPQSYAFAILGAEYVLRWLPRGTHDWRKFPTPEELDRDLAAAGLDPVDTVGFAYDPLTDRWSLSRSTPINYATVAVPK